MFCSPTIITLTASWLELYIQHEPVPPHCRFCHKRQVKSIIKPKRIGPGMLPRARTMSHCTPMAKSLMFAGTTLQKMRMREAGIGVGREAGSLSSWILKISAKKVVFLISSGKKQISPLLAPTPGKNLKKSPRAHHPGKNPYDAHGSRSFLQGCLVVASFFARYRNNFQ